MSEYEGKYAYGGQFRDPKPNRFWTVIRGEGFRCSQCLVYSELGMQRRGIEEVKLCLISCYHLSWVRRVSVLRALEDRASLGQGRELPPAGISGQTMRDLRQNG